MMSDKDFLHILDVTSFFFCNTIQYQSVFKWCSTNFTWMNTVQNIHTSQKYCKSNTKYKILYRIIPFITNSAHIFRLYQKNNHTNTHTQMDLCVYIWKPCCTRNNAILCYYGLFWAYQIYENLHVVFYFSYICTVNCNSIQITHINTYVLYTHAIFVHNSIKYIGKNT